MDKVKKLNNIKKYIDQVNDRLNLKIDEGIKETVVYLNALNIHTLSSCEGHEKWGLGGPWVDIGPKNTKSFLKLTEKIKKIRDQIKKEENKQKIDKTILDKLDAQHYKIRRIEDRHLLKEYRKLFILMKEFYQDRRVDIDRMLILNKTAWGGRLQCQGMEINTFENRKTKKDNLILYREEMDLFTQFLSMKFHQ